MTSSQLIDSARALAKAYFKLAGALHPILDLLSREQIEWDDDTACWVAELTGIPLVSLHGVVTSRTPADAEAIQICTGLSCQWMGAEAACRRLQQVPSLRIVEVDCLGACAGAPVMSRNGRLHDGLTPERLDALLAGDR
jgi:NADH-quinone oxidoreductase subunit E